MAIEVELPDGTIVEFPDGTSDAVMENALKNYAMQQPVQDMPAVQAQMPSPEDREAGVAAALRDMTNAQSGLQNFGIGAGRSVDAGLRGLKQAFTGGLLGQSAAASGALRKLGLGEAADTLNRNIGAPLARSAVEQQALADQRKLIDAPLLDTKAGLAGNIAGTAAQLIGPGVLARGTVAGAALLPRTIGGNALNGAALGYLQPVASDESRGLNTVVGGVAGGAAAGLANVVGAGVRGAASRIRGLLSPAEQVADSAAPQASPGLLSAARPGASAAASRSAEQEAARIIQANALRPQSLLAAAPSQIPGVTRSLTEEALDPGVAALERQMRRNAGPNFGPMFDDLGRINNARRVEALEGINGAVGPQARAAQRQALEDARVAASAQLKPAAMQNSANIEPFVKQLGGLMDYNRGSPEIVRALGNVRGLLAREGDNGAQVLESDPRVIHDVRQQIGKYLAGTMGGEDAMALKGASQLIEARNALDETMGQPWKDWLGSWAQNSRPLNQMDLVDALAARGGVVGDAANNGITTLTPAQFGRAAADLDRLAQQATGFNKASAQDLLGDSGMRTVANVNDDLQRQYFRDTAGSGRGSPTNEAGLMQRSIERAIDGIPYIGKWAEKTRATRAEQTQEAIAYLLQNPAEYRRVAMTLSQPERQALDRALNEAAALSASTASTTAIQ